MLSFRKNGKEICCEAIYGKGKVGQMVIFGQQVTWGKILDATAIPLSQYSCPSIFTIVEKEEGDDGCYTLKDGDGHLIKLQSGYYGSCGQYLYDAQEWLTWNTLKEKEKEICKKRKFVNLKMQIELLKDILVKQGVRIVTKEQAKTLGLD